MKNLILILMFILPSVVFSQRDGSKVMDVNNIDYRLLDSLIIVEINKVRDSLGHKNMNYSRVVSDNVSKVRCEKLHSEQLVYHPDGREYLYTDKLNTSVIKESSTKYKFIGGRNVVDNFEICLFKTKNYKMITYSDIALAIVDLWETSPDHCFVIRDVSKKKTNESLIMSGVSTKYGTYEGRNGFYAVLNLTVVYN